MFHIHGFSPYIYNIAIQIENEKGFDASSNIFISFNFYLLNFEFFISDSLCEDDNGIFN
jgi:hypothetical protein